MMTSKNVVLGPVVFLALVCSCTGRIFPAPDVVDAWTEDSDGEAEDGGIAEGKDDPLMDAGDNAADIDDGEDLEHEADAGADEHDQQIDGSDGASGIDDAGSQEELPPEHDRYEPIEITLFSTKNYANPYIDVDVLAHVVGPAEDYSIPGFWDGGATWRVHFAPRNAGAYQVEITCSDQSNSGLHGVTKTYRVGSSFSLTWAPHGFVRVDTQYRHYLAYDDGTWFPWIGDTNWINLYELAWERTAAKPVTLELWKTLCDKRAEYGFTLLQTVAWNPSERWLDGQYPFGGNNGSNPDLINPVSWQRVDARVQYAVQRGLVVNLLISSNGQHLAWPETQRERLQRYLVARYAAYNVIFGGGEEVDRGGFGSEDKYRHLIDTFHRQDPYRRCVGLHASGYDQILVPDDVDILQIQYYEETVPYDLMKDRARNPYLKPFINAETYYFGVATTDPLAIRRNVWRIFFAGAAGYTYGQSFVAYHKSGFGESDLTDAGTDEMRRFALWWRQPDLRWWEFSRFEDLGSGRYLAAAPNRQYAIFAESQGDFKVNLSDASGELSGRWYNAATGEFGEAVVVSAGPQVALTPPRAWSALLLTPR